MSVYGGTITRAGRNLLTGLVAGQTIEFTKVQFGSGIVPDQTSLETVTELYNYIADGSSNVPIAIGNAIHLVAEYRNEMNPDMQDVFWINEFGIFAKTDSSPEVMIYYASLGETPQPVNPYVDQRIDVKRYPITIAVAVTPDIKLAYNPGTFITEENVDLKVQAAMQYHVANKDNPHAVTKSQVGLGNVDNTADNQKNVKYADEAGTAKKLTNPLTITLGTGSKEGTNKFTCDASKPKTIDITPINLGALPALLSTQYAGCYYRIVNGETEWINPPMESLAEYRTTERFDGKPVYTKLMDFFVDSLEVASIDVPEANTIIRYAGYGSRNDYRFTLPYIQGYDDDGIYTRIAVCSNNGKLVVTNNTGQTGYTLTIQVWFTK